MRKHLRRWRSVFGIIVLVLLVSGCGSNDSPAETETPDVSAPAATETPTPESENISETTPTLVSQDADISGIWEWPARGLLVHFTEEGAFGVGRSPFDFALGAVLDEGTWHLKENTLTWQTADESMFCAGMSAIYQVETVSTDEMVFVQKSDECPARAWGNGEALPPLVRTDLSIPANVEEREINVDGQTMTLHCEGEGLPTVILESGLYDPWTVWWKVQPVIADSARVCAYNRPLAEEGEIRTAPELAVALDGMLSATGLEPPYVLVAHSVGGFIARIYAAEHPEEVAGLVLVDSSHEDELHQLASIMPEDMYEEIAEFQRSAPDGIDLEASGEAARAVSDLGDLPLIVISAAGDANSDLPPEIQEQVDEIWLSLQAQLASLSSAGKQVVAKGSGHNIQLNQPEIVIDSIQEVIEAVRSASELSG